MEKSAEKAQCSHVDLIIRRGRVINSASSMDRIADVAVKNGQIFAVGENLRLTADEEFDASSCIVTPGLIDLHVHCYQYATPLGVNVDESAVARGVTTVVDAGSAGATTFQGLRKYVAEKSKTRVYAFLHIAAHGLASAGCSGHGQGGECDSLNQVDPELCLECIEENRDIIVGVKVRLSADVANDGAYEEEVYVRALEAAKKAGVPLMVHHAFSTIPTESDGGDGLSAPGSMHFGDIYTHMYHGFPNTIIDIKTKRVCDSVKEARNRGVLFDLGHGLGSFSWTVAELCAKESFWPDSISSDLHTGNCHGPAHDLPFIMTKLLHVGMPLPYIIKAVTAAPANAIGKSNVIGSLMVGRAADITLLKIEDCDLQVEDCQSQIRHVTKQIAPEAVWRDGKRHPITRVNYRISMHQFYEQAKDWPRLHVHDECPPCPPGNRDAAHEFLKTI
ncbi:deacetylase Oant_2987-like [Lineus longissimus]|uniref:deacetylase Oant_2987-like n=1 Tax=Lineus longissimus TaxID=88925 RepID=UPI00315DE31B